MYGTCPTPEVADRGIRFLGCRSTHRRAPASAGTGWQQDASVLIAWLNQDQLTSIYRYLTVLPYFIAFCALSSASYRLSSRLLRPRKDPQSRFASDIFAKNLPKTPTPEHLDPPFP